MSAQTTALMNVRRLLRGLHGFLGATARGSANSPVVVISWLEFDPIPALPALVNGVPIIVVLKSTAAAQKTDPKIAGSWLDTWKQAGSDAWAEYTATLKSYWS